jgi:hypothetical protein
MHVRREDMQICISSLLKYICICVTLLEGIYIILQLNFKCKFTFALRG